MNALKSFRFADLGDFLLMNTIYLVSILAAPIKTDVSITGYEYRLGLILRSVTVRTEDVKESAFACLFQGNSSVSISIIELLLTLTVIFAALRLVRLFFLKYKEKAK